MKTLQDILNAAQNHGEESSPDHEIGDLQDMLREFWELMSSEQRAAGLGEAEEQLDQWANEIPCPDCEEVGEPGCETCGGEGTLTASGKLLTEK